MMTDSIELIDAPLETSRDKWSVLPDGFRV
jgi:hypothetical protein